MFFLVKNVFLDRRDVPRTHTEKSIAILPVKIREGSDLTSLQIWTNPFSEFPKLSLLEISW
jgi:hypothetical protein